MTVKKLTVNDLKTMVKEAVALQMKQSASERRKKIEDDKAKSAKNESKTVRVSVDQLRTMVKEAVALRLKENMDMPGVGDLVAYNGKTGYVEDVSPDGKVAVTRDGMRMEWIPMQGVQVLATADDLGELSPEEIGGIGDEMGMGMNQDPGEDPQAELDRISGQLDANLLGKQSRKSLGARQGDLKSKLGIGDDHY